MENKKFEEVEILPERTKNKKSIKDEFWEDTENIKNKNYSTIDDYKKNKNSNDFMSNTLNDLKKELIWKSATSVIFYTVIFIILTSSLIWLLFTFLWTWLAWLLTIIILAPVITFIGVLIKAFMTIKK